MRRDLPKPNNKEITRVFLLQLINELENLIGLTFNKGERIEINGLDSTELTLVSPNGTRYKLMVDDAGNLTTNTV